MSSFYHQVGVDEDPFSTSAPLDHRLKKPLLWRGFFILLVELLMKGATFRLHAAPAASCYSRDAGCVRKRVGERKLYAH